MKTSILPTFTIGDSKVINVTLAFRILRSRSTPSVDVWAWPQRNQVVLRRLLPENLVATSTCATCGWARPCGFLCLWMALYFHAAIAIVPRGMANWVAPESNHP